MNRRWVEKIPDQPGPVKLGQEHHRHLVRVLRMGIGDRVVLFDGTGRESEAEIVKIDNRNMTLQVKQPRFVDREARCDVTLVFALSKGQKPDLVLQKGTELGVRKFMIFLSQRSVPRLAQKKIDERRKRWAAIVQSACTHSGRNFIPQVSFHPSLEDVLPQIKSDLRLCLAVGAKRNLAQVEKSTSQSVALIVGPEGGLTDSEQKLIEDYDFSFVTFGNRILRAETAAIVAVVPFLLDESE